MVGVGMIVRACHRDTFRENCSLQNVHNTVIADQPGKGTIGGFGTCLGEAQSSVCSDKMQGEGAPFRKSKARARRPWPTPRKPSTRPPPRRTTTSDRRWSILNCEDRSLGP